MVQLCFRGIGEGFIMSWGTTGNSTAGNNGLGCNSGFYYEQEDGTVRTNSPGQEQMEVGGQSGSEAWEHPSIFSGVPGPQTGLG